LNTTELLRIISNLASKRAPSGLEEWRGAVFKKEMENIIKEKDIPIKIDELGNVYIKFKGKEKKKSIAIVAHLDEIGGTIRKINKDGTLEFSKRGGYEGRWLVSRRVVILNRDGEWINGIIAGRATHAVPEKLRVKEKINTDEMEIYIGAISKEEAKERYKLHIGAPFVFSGDFGLLNPTIDDKVIAGYSMDNLVALTALISLSEKILKNLLTEFGYLNKSYDLYLVATTREEIGTEGALFFTKNNPIDQVIALDIGIVSDFKGAVSSDITIDGGPVIVWQEARGSGIFDYNLCKRFVDIAEKNKLDFQEGVLEFYGSDAGKTQKWLGISSILIGIPIKYSHNVPEVSNLQSIEKAAELVYQYLKAHK